MSRIWSTYREAFNGLPPSVWWLSLVLFVNRAGAMVITFLALYLTQELGHPLTAAGWMLSIYGAGHLAGAFVGGWLCDRLGALRIQFWALALSGVGYLLLEHVQSLQVMSVLVFLTATAAESFRPANGAALAEMAPPELRARAVALNRLAINLGWAIGPAIGGLLAAYDYRWLFRVDGLTCIGAAFLLARLRRGGRLETPGFAIEERAAETVATHPMRDREFWVFLVLTAAMAALFFQAWGSFPVYLKEIYGFSEAEYGFLMAINALMILLFEVVLTHRAERFSPISVTGLGAFLVGLGFAVLPFGVGWTMASLSIVIWTLGEMLSIPAAGGWVANRASVRHRGKYMGLHTSAWGIAMVFAPVAGTWIYTEFGPNTLWLGLGVVGLVTWLGFELLRKRLERQTDTVAAVQPIPAA